jgi:hypothetical protein
MSSNRSLGILGPVASICIAVWTAAAAAADPSPQAVDAWRRAADLVRSADADLRAVGLERIRDGLEGETFTRDTAEKLLPDLRPDVQVALLGVLADRGDAAALPAIVRLADGKADEAVQGAALRAIGSLGGPAEIPMLVRALVPGPLHAAALRALVEVRGAGPAIVAAVATADPPTRSALLKVLDGRGDRSAMPTFFASLRDPDTDVRTAAIRALTSLAGPDDVAGLIEALLQASDNDRKGLEQALVTVCTVNRRAEEKGRATDLLLARYTAADDAGRDALLPVLARIGGRPVMTIIDGMIADPAQRRRGIEALAKWPNATVADRLLDLSATTTDAREKALLLGALIRIAPLPDNKLDDAGKLALVKKTMALCATDDDRARLLERTSAIRTVEAFRFVVPYLEQPALAPAACRSVVELAHHQKLRDAHKAEFLAALDTVIATTKDAELAERATRYKEGKTWERRK